MKGACGGKTLRGASNCDMAEYGEISAARRGPVNPGWGTVAAALVAGLLLGFLLVSAFVARAGVWSPFAGLLKGRTETIDTSGPAVVEKIRQLARLESVDYAIDKIVEGNKQSAVLPGFLAGDKLLLVAHGEVIGGVDLGQLSRDAITVKGNSVGVRLPAPQVLVTRVDNARTRVYSRTTGLLAPVDPDLESQVRLAAEEEITKAALEDGILDKARQNARVAVTGLLYWLGFRSVEVQ